MPFPAIAAANAAVLETFEKTEAGGALRDLDDVIAADAWARARAREWLAAHGSAGRPRVTCFSYVWAFVLLLSILVFVHELGHFVVARACGVRVLKFSIGFGTADRLRPLPPGLAPQRHRLRDRVVSARRLREDARREPRRDRRSRGRRASGRVAAREEHLAEARDRVRGARGEPDPARDRVRGDARGGHAAPDRRGRQRRARLARRRRRACARATRSPGSRASP